MLLRSPGAPTVTVQHRGRNHTVVRLLAADKSTDASAQPRSITLKAPGDETTISSRAEIRTCGLRFLVHRACDRLPSAQRCACDTDSPMSAVTSPLPSNSGSTALGSVPAGSPSAQPVAASSPLPSLSGPRRAVVLPPVSEQARMYWDETSPGAGLEPCACALYLQVGCSCAASHQSGRCCWRVVRAGHRFILLRIRTARRSV